MKQAALAVAGLTPFSSVDYPGHLAAVVFIAGCPWRCGYCHNPAMQRRSAKSMHWPALLAWLELRVGLLDAVVFSGGEATLDPALPQAMAQARALGFKIGLHTAGMLPQRLPPLLPWLDWVGLDIKTPLDDAKLLGKIAGLGAAGAKRSAAAVRDSLKILAASGVAFECRSTVHPLLHDDDVLRAIGDQLREAGVQQWVLQMARPVTCSQPLPAVGDDYPAPALLAELKLFSPKMQLRRG
ncbi:anaerobic ribonucleoside-triphosphate reductase activating protein [Roseateles albus]|uniref:Anaerobic ribonucleoside-triphosphate reductase activating protein n=1 Tax=Roseateles albus TaxID=2987525 RepID=A0ABT5KHR8_9BURK|nr:anaerobic ribonucleoside-triphosphate reductase activating protein [Roseateles albus]MDC8773487.1 anaerobic ribonucleoside-triphosphate reductase activating protein [Roseateles albus]